MAKIGSQEIARLAQAAGFRGADLQTAVAVALAESGGNTTATNRNTNGTVDTGLWQINSVHGFSNLTDPATNARAAKTVLGRQGWSAWSVFKSGKFLLYMPTAGAAVLSLPGGVATGDPLADKASGAVQSGVSTLGDITGAKAAGQALSLAAKAGTWINDPRNWLRIAYVVLGGALVIGALVMIVAPVASNVVSAGKIVNAVKG